MDALFLIFKLLEKASVLVAVVLVLILIRPASVWLRETGRKASLRRRLFLAVVLGAVAVWGVFLGMDVDGQRFNVRMLGVVVAGFLGGRKVGIFVGALAGAVYAAISVGSAAGYAFASTVLVGFAAGWWSRVFGTGLGSVIAGATVAQLAYHLVIGGVMVGFHPGQAAAEAANVWLHLAKITANVVGVVVFMGLLNLVDEAERWREDALESKAIARSARLEALQYQVRPHFLFNLLNTLAYLIRTDPQKARALTLDLSDFLRYTLSTEREETSLRDELEQIRRYVDLERSRFGDELRFDVSVSSEVDTGGLRVPPLILQPIVENSIRHGARDSRVHVELSIERVDSGVEIVVLDDGPGPQSTEPAKDDRSGVGLANVRERLHRFYGDPVELVLESRSDGGARVSFVIPD